MRKALYAGSFDPPTLGHENVIDQVLGVFDEVVIAVLKNPNKEGFFTLEERIEILKEIYQDDNRVHIVTGEGAAVDIAMENDCCVMARGLRGVDDVSYELNMATTNRQISNGEMNTVAFFADLQFQNVSSSMVKDVYRLGKSVDCFVNPVVEKRMVKKYGR